MSPVRVLQAVLICLLSLGGCSSFPHRVVLPADIEHTLPRVVMLDDTPFFPQTDYQCGPAALATVLTAQGIDTSPEALSPQVYLPGRKGSLQIEMIATARRHHALPYVLDASFTSLLQEVAAGNPVLVLQNLGLSGLPRWHYAVVTGFDLDRDVLALRSGTLKERLTSFAVFLRTWQRADNWALVIVPAAKVPATATVSAYLEAAHGFEETGLAGQAAVAYRAATVHWPRQAETWLMSGNMAYAEQRMDEAVADFLQATRLVPADTRAWNNLAYALREQGCMQQAKAALQCALRISPGDSNLQDSLQEISGSIPDQQAESCKPIYCGLTD
jgi:hypothetical protein